MAVSSSALSSSKIRPVGMRLLNTMPGGWSRPIFSAIKCRPRGVPNEPFTLEAGLEDVEMTNACASLLSW
jgi:hypothetical protein